MTSDGDPYRHVPALRALIVDPLVSIYRNFDMAMVDEMMRSAGAPKDWRHSDSYREETRQEALRDRLNDDLWVFAYGSLMWDPGFCFSEVRTARLQGYHRSFCLQSVLGRGSPECPGLMAGLDRGGSCRGLAFRIESAQVDQETRIIWQREMLLHAYVPSFLPIETELGNVEALAFVVDLQTPSYRPGLSLEQTAGYMASGAGVFGTSLEYLQNLAEHFEALGIEDEELFRLYARTLEKLEESAP